MLSETQCGLTSFVSQVLLGSNGSGKSTILKLISRLYDPTEGTILIDGHDIKTLRMEDIRRAMAILFQDYTLFPVTVRLYALHAILEFADMYTHRLEKTSPSEIPLTRMMTPR
jgi:ABC-type proline/glycine betaine transport system ATPase subunit